MSLRTRGETVEEFAAAAAVMRAKCNKVVAPAGAIDIDDAGRPVGIEELQDQRIERARIALPEQLGPCRYLSLGRGKTSTLSTCAYIFPPLEE